MNTCGWKVKILLKFWLVMEGVPADWLFSRLARKLTSRAAVIARLDMNGDIQVGELGRQVLLEVVADFMSFLNAGFFGHYQV